MDLAELAKVGYFRQDTLPAGTQPELMVTRHHVPDRHITSLMVFRGAQVEVDIDTGFIKLLGWWVADDCGRVVNPLMVDEQIRGGVIQGIGNTLYEHSQYDETGQLLNATLADYLLPMSGEMPDVEIAHVETPLTNTELGANGIGESGTIGAIAVLWCAVNDALRPLGAQVTKQPFTPEHILEVLSPSKEKNVKALSANVKGPATPVYARLDFSPITARSLSVLLSLMRGWPAFLPNSSCLLALDSATSRV